MNDYTPILKTAAFEFKDFNSGIDFHWYHKNQTIFHCHDYFEISLIVKGNIIQECNDKRDLLTKGTLSFLKPIDSHQYFPYNNDSISLLNFSITEETLLSLCNSITPSLYHHLPHIAPYTIQLSDSVLNYILFAVKQLSINETLGNNELNNASIKSIIHLLLLQIYRSFTLTPTNEIPSWLTSFLLKINSPDYFNLPISQLYKLAPYSQTALSAYMKQYLNKTLVEYIKEIKFNYAKNLLLNSDYSIEQIAAKISYTTNHFIREFHKLNNTTPFVYRHTYQKNSIK